MMIFAGPIGCHKGGTDFFPGPRDSTFDCIGETAATNRVRTGVKSIVSRVFGFQMFTLKLNLQQNWSDLCNFYSRVIFF